MRKGLAGAAIAAMVVFGAARAEAQESSAAVRPEDAGIRALIAAGNERSGTFRELASRLDRTDMVVYVRFSRCAGGVPACLVWASVAAGPRRLLIKLDQFGRSPDALTALLAHELQHANEVASTPEIRDQASFGKRFASLGWQHGDGFETIEAKQVSKRVAMELTR